MLNMCLHKNFSLLKLAVVKSQCYKSVIPLLYEDSIRAFIMKIMQDTDQMLEFGKDF